MCKARRFNIGSGKNCARFLAEKNGIEASNGHLGLVNFLQRDRSNPIISAKAYAAFRTIRGRPTEDRNTYHHLTDDLEQNRHVLTARAEECLNALYEIESEIFAYSFDEGRVVPKHPKYWPAEDDNRLVYVRQR
jgi:hypothetical protein